MNEMSDVNNRVPKGFFFHGQIQHLMMLLLIVPGAWLLISPALDDGAFLGMSDRVWAALLIGIVVIHQVLVWLVFRGQICYSTFTRMFGRADLTVWGILFFPFLIARPLVLLGVGLSDCNSLGISRPLEIGVGVVLLIPVVYTLWSVGRYFGVERALGGDHFREKYGHMPMVREGAFKYNSNAMYSYVFLGLWAIALFCGSRAALGLALFQHAYIWVHVYCTENPDIEILYGPESDS